MTFTVTEKSIVSQQKIQGDLMRTIDIDNPANIDLAKILETVNEENINNISDDIVSVEDTDYQEEEITVPKKEEKSESDIIKDTISETIENMEEEDTEETLYDSNTIKVVMDDYKELKKQYDELNSKYLRTMADFGNFRKRNLEENRQKIEKSKVGLLKEIISLADTFDRAINDAESNESFENLLEGVKAIQKMVTFTLEKENVRPIEAQQGEKFNPELHDCILVVPMPGTEAETIIEETEKGYIMNKTVVRPSKVVVSGGSPEVSENQEEEPEETGEIQNDETEEITNNEETAEETV